MRDLDGSKSGSINCMDISADGHYFVTGGDDKLVKVGGLVILNTLSKFAFGIKCQIHQTT